jgi:Fe-S cluster biogenesis protein NfuA
MPERIEEVIAPLRDALRYDGADLEFKGEEDGIAYFRLEVSGASCEDCVVPREMLESMILTSLQSELGHLAGVVVEDPRRNAANG